MDSKVNAICKALTERLDILFEFGITKIWMRAFGNSRYDMSNVLGISTDDLALIVDLSGLFKSDKRMKNTSSWQQLLGFSIETHSLRTNGKHGFWF